MSSFCSVLHANSVTDFPIEKHVAVQRWLVACIFLASNFNSRAHGVEAPGQPHQAMHLQTQGTCIRFLKRSEGGQVDGQLNLYMVLNS
jgi:hypothetical protein